MIHARIVEPWRAAYLVEACTEQEVVVPILASAAIDVDEKVRYEAACAFGRLIASTLNVLWRRGSRLTPRAGLEPGMRAESIKALRRLLHDQASQRGSRRPIFELFGPTQRRKPTLPQPLGTRTATCDSRRRGP